MTSDNINMLIAEDDPISRKLLEKLVRETWKGNIIVTKDGQEAWDEIEKEFASLLIIDWMMPRMNGIELCRKIRNTKFDRYVYIILLTARDDQEDVLEGLDAGADDYIRKPFNPQELKLRIKSGLRVIRLENELRILNDKLEKLATIDPLMQIGNRHSFHEAIEKVHNRFLRYGQGYGIIMCDVDHFKQYNDTLGHQAGDEVLREVAKGIKQNLRDADEAFRYGGEEIVAILPSQDSEGTFSTAERLCEGISELNIDHPKGIDGKVSISTGCSACSVEDQTISWEELLEQADQALYEAKESGRNRAVIKSKELLTAKP